jgi:hypothetical protein
LESDNVTLFDMAEAYCSLDEIGALCKTTPPSKKEKLYVM